MPFNDIPSDPQSLLTPPLPPAPIHVGSDGTYIYISDLMSLDTHGDAGTIA